MAVVSKTKCFIDHKNREYSRSIVYRSKDKVFACVLPDFVVEHLMLKEKEIEGKTQQEVENLWDAKIKEYNEAKRVTSTVILFRVQLNGAVPFSENPNAHVADHNSHMFQLYEKEMYWQDITKLGMVIQWGVYKKERYQEKGKYTKMGDRIKGGIGFNNGWGDRWEDEIGDEIKEIEYTEERATWFQSLQSTFVNLLCNVRDKLKNLDSDGLAMIADQGSFKLLKAE